MNRVIKFTSVLFDMDGVLRIHDSVIPQAKTIFTKMCDMGINYGVFTNECRYTHDTIKKELGSMGIENIGKAPICTPNDVIASFFKKRLENTNKTIQVGIFGEHGLKHTMNTIHNSQYNIKETPILQDELSTEYYTIVGAMNQCTDTEIKRAKTWFSLPNCKIIITCNDMATMGEVLYLPRDFLTKCNVSMDKPYCFGKPNPLYFQYAIQHILNNEVDKEKILFVGDSMDTDIRGSFENNITNCLVLTGNTKNSETIKQSVIQPNYIIQTLDQLPFLL